MITERSAYFIANTHYADIPHEALDMAKSAVMDLVGVGLAGSTSEAGITIAATIKTMGGNGISNVIGNGFKVSPYLAALANGTMAHAIDYDDVSFYWYEGHPSACLVPAALAMGEMIGAHGKDILASYVVGFEVAAAINSLVNQSHRKQGWHATSTIGGLGAAAVASNLLKLDAHKARLALGIAASLAGGLNQNTGTMTKPLHAGHAASNGILAALLAQQGFTAAENIIEAPQGFAKVFGCQDEIDWDKASEHLGKKYIIATPAVEFKRYPSCGFTTGFIDVALSLKRQHNINPNMIGEIVLRDTTYPGSAKNFSLPETGLEAEFSREYCVCRALVDGKVAIQHFENEKLKQPEVVRLMKLTKLFPNFYPASQPGREKTLYPQAVIIKLQDGTQYSGESKIYNGRRGEPMNSGDLETKYKDCASMVLPLKDVDRSLKMFNKLESLDDIRKLMSIIGKTG